MNYEKYIDKSILIQSGLRNTITTKERVKTLFNYILRKLKLVNQHSDGLCPQLPVRDHGEVLCADGQWRKKVNNTYVYCVSDGSSKIKDIVSNDLEFTNGSIVAIRFQETNSCDPVENQISIRIRNPRDVVTCPIMVAVQNSSDDGYTLTSPISMNAAAYGIKGVMNYYMLLGDDDSDWYVLYLGNETNNLPVTSSYDGLCPKLPDDATKILNGVGEWLPFDHASIGGLLDATRISGVIPLKNLPQGAMDKLINVDNRAARLALSRTDDIENGNLVQEDDTGLMYRIVDKNMLGTSTPEKAFKEYTAGRATYAAEAGMVNGHTVDADVPSNAKFTDTTVTFYGTCKSAANVKDKVITISSDQGFKLRVGVMIGVLFSNTNTYSSTADSPITFNVNNTGAKTLYWGNASKPTGTATIVYGSQNHVHYYMYNGSQWVWAGWSKEKDTTYGVATASANGLCPKLPTADSAAVNKYLNGNGAWSIIDKSKVVSLLGFTPLDARYFTLSSTVTLSTGSWKSVTSSGNTYYTYTITIKTKVSDSPFLNLLPANSATVIPTQTEFVEFGKIVNVIASASSVVIYAFEKPTVNLKVTLQGVQV